MENDTSTRNHIYIQNSPYRFQSVTWAPEKGGDGKVRFAVESMIYVSGMGLDAVNPFTQSNEFMIALRDYIRIKELIGYKHLGMSSTEITILLNNLWKKDSWEKSNAK